MKPINDKNFSHLCRYGTLFIAPRCDFRDGVNYLTKGKLKPEQFASDVAEMIGYHARNIWPDLDGFQGYDCITFNKI